MRVLLQQKGTGLYYKDKDLWTHLPADAVDFLCSTKAIDFCVANRLSNVQLVLKFDQQSYDIVLPMVAERSHVSSTRPGTGSS
jgi:hypothetical protein